MYLYMYAAKSFFNLFASVRKFIPIVRKRGLLVRCVLQCFLYGLVLCVLIDIEIVVPPPFLVYRIRAYYALMLKL